jgi:hypothetical protein
VETEPATIAYKFTDKDGFTDWCLLLSAVNSAVFSANCSCDYSKTDPCSRCRVFAVMAEWRREVADRDMKRGESRERED